MNKQDTWRSRLRKIDICGCTRVCMGHESAYIILEDFISSELQRAGEEGVELGTNWMIAGVGTTIEGVDYVKLEDLEKRQEECLQSLSKTKGE